MLERMEQAELKAVRTLTQEATAQRQELDDKRRDYKIKREDKQDQINASHILKGLKHSTQSHTQVSTHMLIWPSK